MPKPKKNPKVEFFFRNATRWQKELEKLRSVVFECNLEEELKWGVPCYTSNDHNVVLMHHFKEYCALLFFKGALLKDAAGILIQQTKNVQAARQVRFTSVQEITKHKTAVKAYISEAIELEKSGLKVEFKKTAQFAMPLEFQEKLKNSSALRRAFDALTPGRQRAYLLHFSAAKQAKTREARIEKVIPQILLGKGLND